MVLEKLIPVSWSTKAAPAPKPPTLKEIREDLERTNDRDVAFANSEVVTVHITEGISEEKLTMKSNSKGQEKDDASAAKPKGEKSYKEVYEEVTLLLKEHKALIEAQQTLKTLGPNLESEKLRIEESIERVRTSWNMIK